MTSPRSTSVKIDSGGAPYNLRADPAQPDGLAKDAYGYHIPVPLKNAKSVTVNVKVTLK